MAEAIGSSQVPVYIDENGIVKTCDGEVIKGTYVSKIIAGSNVFLKPTSGTGEVTISCTGGGGSGGAVACPLLTPMWIDYEAIDDGWVWSDDEGTYYIRTAYQKIYDHLYQEYTGGAAVDEGQIFTLADGSSITINYKRCPDGHKICAPDQKTKLDQLINDANIGTAWFFVLDTTNEKFVLPRTKYGFHGEREYAKADEAETGVMKLYFSTGVTVISSGGIGGGVINGKLWFDPTPFTTTFTAGVTKNIYTVQNDCGLYIKMTDVPVSGSIQFFIDGNPIYSANDVAGNGPQGHGTVIAVAKGTVIQARVTEGAVSNHTFTMYEYKLNSLSAQLAFPDWNEAKRSENLLPDMLSGTPYAVSENGFLFCNLCMNAGKVLVKVNGATVASWFALLSEGSSDFCSHIVQVSVGDVVTVERTDTTQPADGSVIYHYPAKSMFGAVEASTKADKKVPTADGNLALLDATGNLKDSEKNLSNLASTEDLTKTEAKLRYDIKAVTNNGQMSDRAVNTITMNGNVTLKLPAQVTGKVRDFILTMSVTMTGLLTLQTPEGTAFTSFMYDENGDDPLSIAYAAGGTYQFYFTESVAQGVFRVECTKLVSHS